MEAKIKKLLDRFKEVEDLLGQSETFSDQKLYKELSQEHAYLSRIKETWEYLNRVSSQLIENKNLLVSEKDPELIEIIKEEIENLQREVDLSDKKLRTLLVPPDPTDNRNIILEIRAGTGGAEAALFVADCEELIHTEKV